MSVRRVLVTGAGGFVGGAIVTGLLERGLEVVGVDHSFAPGAPKRLARREADLARGVPPDRPEADLVIHAAWITTEPDRLGVSAAAYVGMCLRPLLSVVEHVARSRPHAFVFLSSSGVFAPGDGDRGLTDRDEATGAAPYSVAKRAAELLVPAALTGTGVAPHVARLGYVYGPDEAGRPTRDRLSPIGSWLDAAGRGEPLLVGADDPERDWTFAPDLAAALLALVGGAPHPDPVHLGSGHVRRDREVAALVAENVPGTVLEEVAAESPLKPPMVPSELPALRDFAWTPPEVGIAALTGVGA